jgi:hypothetical protein
LDALFLISRSESSPPLNFDDHYSISSLQYKKQPVINGQLKKHSKTDNNNPHGLAIPRRVHPQACPLPFHQKMIICLVM